MDLLCHFRSGCHCLRPHGVTQSKFLHLARRRALFSLWWELNTSCSFTCLAVSSPSPFQRVIFLRTENCVVHRISALRIQPGTLRALKHWNKQVSLFNWSDFSLSVWHIRTNFSCLLYNLPFKCSSAPCLFFKITCLFFFKPVIYDHNWG